MAPDETKSGSSGQRIHNPQVNPGDEAAPGVPGTGENVCPDCKGSGRLDNAPCQTCGGTGKVIEGVGGA
jgi:DnaJ-class molecular chaperone